MVTQLVKRRVRGRCRFGMSQGLTLSGNLCQTFIPDDPRLLGTIHSEVERSFVITAFDRLDWKEEP